MRLVGGETLSRTTLNTHLLPFLVCRRSVRLHVVKLRLHGVQPLVEVVVSAGEARGQLQGLLQRAEGLAAAGRHLGVARLDAVQLLLDQEDLLACTEGVRSRDGYSLICGSPLPSGGRSMSIVILSRSRHDLMAAAFVQPNNQLATSASS